jgi:CHAT domain-containing protein
VVVANVNPPAYLQLATLTPWAADQMPVATLSGPAATPTRVLTAIRDATEIQFHTHALVDAGISDASHLVLSPEDGGYALTAEAIRHGELRGHPIVVLAACHSAQGARYQHAAWSLPDAFLAVGARAVLAAGSNIPDLQSGPFFTRVLDQIRAGVEPARALRDERVRALATDPSSWIADVMLFE